VFYDTISRAPEKISIVNKYYKKHAAKIKRSYCLFLHKMGLLKPFSFVMWLATYKCNCTCPFCEASAGEAHPDELTTLEAKALIDDLAQMGVKRFLISGGEPLERPDIIELMEYANRRKLNLGLVSNGYRVEELWKDLSRFNYSIYFTSIDGLAPYHDKMRGKANAFSHAIKSLELFEQKKVKIRMVNTVVHPGNIHQMEPLLKMLKDGPANLWHLCPAAKVGRAENDSFSLSGKELRYLSEFIKGNRKVMNLDFGESYAYLWCFDGSFAGKAFFCGAGLVRCSVMPDGEVLGCHQVYDKAYSEGNIRNKSFSKIWKEEFSRFRKKDFRSSCKKCEHFYACQGGCWGKIEKQGACLKGSWHKK